MPTKITALPNSNLVNDADLLLIVDDPGGTPVSQKRTILQIKDHIKMGASSDFLVAASNATAKEIAMADYLCDGVADQVQINLALVDVRTTGGMVKLSSGSFALAGSIIIQGLVAEGGDNAQVRFLGSGIDSTFLNGATNVDLIRTSQRAKYEIAYMTLAVAGSGDGIFQDAGTERGNWQSHVHDLFIKSNFVDHTGWGIDMESPFRMRFENIEMNGVANGMWLRNHVTGFNSGNLSIDRLFIDLWNNASNANAIGFRLSCSGTAATDTFNLVSVNRLDIFGGNLLTGSRGVVIEGSISSFGDSRHHTFTNMNIEDVLIAFDFIRGRDNTFIDLNYTRVLSGGTIARFDSNSHNNSLENAYVVAQGTGQTITLINDANGSSNLPNTLKRVNGFQPSSVTINATLASTTILEQVDLSGGSPTVNAVITGRNNRVMLQQFTTAAAPAYARGAMYFDTTLNKARVGGATTWETITST